MHRGVPLLPAPPKQAQGSDHQGHAVVLPPRRPQVSSTCEECRKRKSKCDGLQPCSLCRKRMSDCEYSTRADIKTRHRALQNRFDKAQQESNSLRRLYDILKEKPQDTALIILDQIRRGMDPEEILQMMDDGDLLMQLHLTPDSHHRYTFPYRTAMPSALLETRSTYMESIILEASYHRPGPPPLELSDSTPTAGLQRPYYMPYQSAKLVGPLLDRANISYWTTVCSDEALLHNLGEAYFLHIYTAFPLLHKDSFLDDLCSRRHRFCSNLLVNAILAHACHATSKVAYRNEYWNPNNLGYLFLAEFRRLLELEADQKEITTIQAMLVINITMNEQGIDVASHRYLVRAVSLAQSMDLFGRQMTEDGDKSSITSMTIVRQVTAWTMFASQAVMSSMLYKPPLIPDPPQTPIPDPATNLSWYGDFWLQYPLTQMFLSAKQSHTFNAYLQFWTIFNSFSHASFPPSPERRLTLEQTTRFYARLLVWFNGLPDSLRPERIVFPSQLKLHIQYWALLMDLFKPFADSNDQIRGMARSPSSIYLEARLRFKLVMRIYYLRHGSENYDSWLFMFLVKLGFASIQELGSGQPSDREVLRSTLILALTGIANQGKCYYMAEVVLRTICENEQMNPEDLILLKQFISFKDIGDSQVIAERFKLIQSDWPIDMSFADDPEWKNIHKVLDRTLKTRGR